LRSYFDQLNNKDSEILIPGAGNAYEAAYLADKGFKNVWVCDFAEAPLKNLLSRCKNIDSAHLIKSDFFLLDEKMKQFDLIIEQTFFCAIDPALRRKYFEKTHALLKPGGKLVGLLFNEQFSSPPPFGGSEEEYRKYFADLFKIKVFEPCTNSIKPRAGRELFINLVKV
jgi:methyl halide transferase